MKSKKVKSIKPVRGWAVVKKDRFAHENISGECSCAGSYEGYSIHKTKKEALDQIGWYFSREDYKVIQVLISPLKARKAKK